MPQKYEDVLIFHYLRVCEVLLMSVKVRNTFLVLELLFGTLMSLPWLVPHTGFLALVGLLPLLWMEKLARENGTRHFWLWHYSAFVLWNALTTFWVCNATVGGGVFAVLANALQMSLVFGLFRLSRKHQRGALPYIFLALMWTAWERVYFSAQISWPWLVLGNAFARSTRLIQWYEYTGTLGGSLWIWACNLALFAMISALRDRRWQGFTRWGKGALAVSLAAVFAVPVISSLSIYHNYEEVSEGKMDVLIAQPNFDPYQKFQTLSQKQQTAILLSLLRPALGEERGDSSRHLLLLAPETFCDDITCGEYESSPTWQRLNSFSASVPASSIIFGASTYEYFTSQAAPSANARPLRDGKTWYESHNSALCVDGSGSTEIYHKSKLVVGVEMTPYPGIIGPLARKLGAPIGHCTGQEEISLLHPGGVPVGCAVCYESIYGEFCTGYVRKGAQLMTVITNDAWWGNTPGYRQHFSYSRLRAIELRRDIARCGNTGISAFIDQRGDVLERGPWWESATLSGTVNLNSRQTYFVRHGDICGRISTFAFLLLLLNLLSDLVLKGRRRTI